VHDVDFLLFFVGMYLRFDFSSRGLDESMDCTHRAPYSSPLALEDRRFICIEPTVSLNAALEIIVDSLTSQSLDYFIDNHLVATALPRILEGRWRAYSSNPTKRRFNVEVISVV
jgi:hypothetical protein